MCRAKSAMLPSMYRAKTANLLLKGSNADFAPHMERSHADFALHMERRHIFRDQQIAKIAISAIVFFFFSFKPPIS